LRCTVLIWIVEQQLGLIESQNWGNRVQKVYGKFGVDPTHGIQVLEAQLRCEPAPGAADG
jgi:hypothetical protein